MPRSSDWKLWLCVLTVPGTIARRRPVDPACARRRADRRARRPGSPTRDDRAVDREHRGGAARAGSAPSPISARSAVTTTAGRGRRSYRFGDRGEVELVRAQRRARASLPSATAGPGGRARRSCASICTGDSLNRKLFTGRVIAPFSIRKTPSRVRPVTRIVCGSSQRRYQNRVMSTPRLTPLTSSSRVAVPPSRIQPGRAGRSAGLPCFCAQ